MQVILLERVEKLGQMGDVVNVKPGFARNYLLPQRKALRATKENATYFESRRAQLEAQNLKLRQEAENVAKKMEGLAVTVLRQAGETGQLYGSVNNRDLASAITAAGFTVDRRQVLLDSPIKARGVYKLRVALHPEVIVTVSANVAQSEDEAAAQAAGKTAAPVEAAADAAVAPPPAAAAPADEAAPKKKADAEPKADAKKAAKDDGKKGKAKG